MSMDLHETLMRVLMVDDDPQVSGSNRMLLDSARTTNIRVDWTTSCIEARERLSREWYDVCLLDGRLANREGLELMRSFRKKKGERPRFVVLGNIRDHELGAKVLAAGAWRYLDASDSSGLANSLCEIAGATPPPTRREPPIWTFDAADMREVLDDANFGVCITDAHGMILFANPSFAGAHGFMPHEAVGRTLASFLEPGQEHIVANALHRARTDGKISGIEVTHRHRHGTTFPMLLNAGLIHNEDGPTCIAFTAVNITAWKHAQEALKRERDFTATVFDTMITLVVVLDAEGRVVRFNRACERTTGYAAADALGRYVWEIPWVCADAAWLAQFFAAPSVDLLPLQFETECLTKSGSKRIIVWSTASICTPGDTLDHVIMSGADVTDRRRADERVMRLAAAVENANEAVMITDAEARIQYVNPAFERTSGYSREQVVGKTPSLFKSGTQNTRFYGDLWADLRAGKAWEGTMINKRKDGTLYEEEITISPIRDATDEIVNYVAVKRDVTLERSLEAQVRHSQKMDVIGRLAGGIAHDFNNLLTTILGTTELMLQDSDEDGPMNSGLCEIRQAASRASALTRQLLAFGSKQTVQPRAVDLNELVRNMSRLLQRLIGEDIRLTMNLVEEPLSVYADPSQLEQIVMNLAVNARDAMPTGGTLTLATEWIEPDRAAALSQGRLSGPGILLTVSDSGSGIAPEVLPKIFDPFFTTKRENGGTGLGLATVHGIVDQAQGHVWAESPQGGGTRFSILLPRESTKPATQEESPQRPIPKANGAETLLVVEDEHTVRRSVVRSLAICGYTVLQAETGEDALELLREHPEIRLLVTDVIMPGISGPELARDARRHRPDLRVLYMSGYPDKTIFKQGLVSPQDPFMHKPFTFQELTETVRRLLDAT